MRRFLFLCHLAFASAVCMHSAQAQHTLAGHSANTTYVDIAPDKIVSASRATPNNTTDQLDLDGDGRYDLGINSYVSAASFPGETEARISPLHDEVAVYSNSQTPMIIRFAFADTIQQTIRQTTPGPPPTWGSRTTIYPYGPSWLVRRGNNPAGNQSFGAWLDGQDGYIGVRLRAGSGWRYGWVRLQVTSVPTDQMIITVKDYALGSITLGRQKPSDTGWHLYPVPASNYLTVQAPAPTTGQLIVYDNCGRVQLTEALSSATQQINIAALPAGLYYISLKTNESHFTKRFTKQ